MTKSKHQVMEAIPPPSRYKKALRSTTRESGKWEIAALTICITSYLAIVVVASTRHGKPPPIFPLGVTLNAVVAIFSTLMKTTMLYCASDAISQSKWLWLRRRARSLADVEVYDQASRGPWGALTILRNLRWRYAGFKLILQNSRSCTDGLEIHPSLEP